VYKLLNERRGVMSFKCENCNNTVSDSKMLGMAVVKVGREVLGRKLGKKNFSGRDLTAGILTGLDVECPKCHESNWKST